MGNISGKNEKTGITLEKIKISKNKKMRFFSCRKDHSTQKLGYWTKMCALQPGDRRTDSKYKEYIRKKRKNGHNSGKNQNFKKTKKCVFSHVARIIQPKN